MEEMHITLLHSKLMSRGFPDLAYLTDSIAHILDAHQIPHTYYEAAVPERRIRGGQVPDELTQANSVLVTAVAKKTSELEIAVVYSGKIVCPAQWVVGPYSTAVGKRVAIELSHGMVHGAVQLADGSAFIDPGAAKMQVQPDLMKELAAIEVKNEESAKQTAAVEEMKERLAENERLRALAMEQQKQHEEDAGGEAQRVAQELEEDEEQFATLEHEAQAAALQGRLRNLEVGISLYSAFACYVLPQLTFLFVCILHCLSGQN